MQWTRPLLLPQSAGQVYRVLRPVSTASHVGDVFKIVSSPSSYGFLSSACHRQQLCSAERHGTDALEGTSSGGLFTGCSNSRRKRLITQGSARFMSGWIERLDLRDRFLLYKGHWACISTPRLLSRFSGLLHNAINSQL